VFALGFFSGVEGVEDSAPETTNVAEQALQMV